MKRFFYASPLSSFQFWLLIIAAVLLLAAWLWITRPLLINPFAVLSALESGTVEPTMMVLMAGLLPAVTLACLFVLLCTLLLVFAAFANERRHLEIIRRFQERDADPPTGRK